MREILFRAKRVDNCTWVTGYYMYHSKREKHVILTHGSKFIEVIPETVGQFTGITDKNGVKIFEGDILLFGDTSFVVEWQNDIAGFGYLDTSDRVLGCDGINCEVIGNIH